MLTYASPDAHLSWRATPVAEHRERPQRQPFVGVAAGTQSDSDDDAAIGCRDWVWDAATGPFGACPWQAPDVSDQIPGRSTTWDRRRSLP